MARDIREIINEDLDFSALTHSYFYKGRGLMSVTRSFEKVGATDFSKVPFSVIEPARELGDIVHDMAAMYGNKVLDEETVELEYQGYLRAIRSFYKERVKKIIAIEQKVYNLAFCYAGQFDIAYLDKDRALCIDDFKTPQKDHKVSKFQTAAYAYAWENLTRQKVKSRATILLRADGNYKREEHKNPLRRDFDDFLTIHRCAVLLTNEKLGR